MEAKSKAMGRLTVRDADSIASGAALPPGSPREEEDVSMIPEDFATAPPDATSTYAYSRRSYAESITSHKFYQLRGTTDGD